MLVRRILIILVSKFQLCPVISSLLVATDTSKSTPGSPLVGSSPERRAPNCVNSSDEDEQGTTDELQVVSGFDQFGVQRCVRSPVSPSECRDLQLTKNRDWREFSRRR
jgi:hypothetical protein